MAGRTAMHQGDGEPGSAARIYGRGCVPALQNTSLGPTIRSTGDIRFIVSAIVRSSVRMGRTTNDTRWHNHPPIPEVIENFDVL